MKYMNQSKKYGPQITARNAATGATIVGTLLFASESALAEVPAVVTTSFTEMATDFGTIFAAGFTVLALIVSSMMVWRYFKKLGNKA